MTRISSSELRARRAEALRSAAGGDPGVITRHGKSAVAWIGADQPRRLEHAAAPSRRRHRRADSRVPRGSTPGVRFSPPGGHSAGSRVHRPAGARVHRPAGGLPEPRSLRQGLLAPSWGAIGGLPRARRPAIARGPGRRRVECSSGVAPLPGGVGGPGLVLRALRRRPRAGAGVAGVRRPGADPRPPGQLEGPRARVRPVGARRNGSGRRRFQGQNVPCHP